MRKEMVVWMTQLGNAYISIYSNMESLNAAVPSVLFQSSVSDTLQRARVKYNSRPIFKIKIEVKSTADWCRTIAKRIYF